jgi:hypothetical protein
MSRDKGLGHIVALEVNLHLLLPAELLAKASHGGRDTQKFQF